MGIRLFSVTVDVPAMFLLNWKYFNPLGLTWQVCPCRFLLKYAVFLVESSSTLPAGRYD